MKSKTSFLLVIVKGDVFNILCYLCRVKWNYIDVSPCRFVLSETVRRDREDRLKAIVTTEGVYFVRARGTPSPESIVLLVRFSDLYVCQPLSTGKIPLLRILLIFANKSL